jgi:hypothetical protein
LAAYRHLAGRRAELIEQDLGREVGVGEEVEVDRASVPQVQRERSPSRQVEGPDAGDAG